jgi:hypothetical protein
MMTLPEKELIISKIIAGCFVVEIEDNLGKSIQLLVKPPTRVQRYMAEQVYKEALYRAELAGSYTEIEHRDFLESKDLWDADKQKRLDDCPKMIEDLKVNLFECVFKSIERDKTRQVLVRVREEFKKLSYQLHEYDYLSAVGVASMTKARYLLAASLHRMDESKLFRYDELWAVSDYLIEAVAGTVSGQKLNESQLREIARTDPWRTIWMSRKSEAGVFGMPAVDLSEEQRLLSVWSGVYDNIYEHPECPDEKVITDDDMLDGWMISQKRKRDTERGGQSLEGIVHNEKIRGDEEIFIPVDTAEDSRRISKLNDPAALAIKRKREALMAQKGTVSETDMPDSQMKIRMQLNQMFIEHAHGKG